MKLSIHFPENYTVMLDDQYGYEMSVYKEGWFEYIDFTGISPQPKNPCEMSRLLVGMPWFRYKRAKRKLAKMERTIIKRLQEETGYDGDVHYQFS